jgi:D-alanine-D-alanine ligase
LATSLPRVLILYNQPVLPPGHPDYLSEIDVVETVGEIEKVFPAGQYTVEKFAYARDPQLLLRKLEAWRPDAVFNLYEGEPDRTETEIHNAALLEAFGVSFTGAGAFGLALARDKIRAKYLLQGAGVRTAPFRVIDRPPAGDWPHPWPAIVKPAYQDASVGIDQGAVVTTSAELEARVAWVFDTYGGPVLVEQFIHGRELHVHLFDDSDGRLHLVPPAEVRFQLPPGQGLWSVYSYEAKWNEQSVEFKSMPIVGAVELPPPLADRVADICTTAYRLTLMRDYARVDLRVDDAGEPHVIEVNPNPHLNSLMLIQGLKAMGREFPGFVRGLVANALERARRPTSSP